MKALINLKMAETTFYAVCADFEYLNNYLNSLKILGKADVKRMIHKCNRSYWIMDMMMQRHKSEPPRRHQHSAGRHLLRQGPGGPWFTSLTFSTEYFFLIKVSYTSKSISERLKRINGFCWSVLRSSTTRSNEEFCVHKKTVWSFLRQKQTHYISQIVFLFLFFSFERKFSQNAKRFHYDRKCGYTNCQAE